MNGGVQNFFYDNYSFKQQLKEDRNVKYGILQVILFLVCLMFHSATQSKNDQLSIDFFHLLLSTEIIHHVTWRQKYTTKLSHHYWCQDVSYFLMHLVPATHNHDLIGI